MFERYFWKPEIILSAKNISQSHETEAEVEAEAVHEAAVDGVDAGAGEPDLDLVKNIIVDVVDVASAVVDVDTDHNANEEQEDQEVQDEDQPVQEEDQPVQEEDQPVPESGGNDAGGVSIRIVKTGQIMIEETDLGDDECVRTEIEIEEVLIGE